jgi:hypothetical protein
LAAITGFSEEITALIVREQVALQLLNASDMEAASFFETSVALTNLFDIIFQKT